MRVLESIASAVGLMAIGAGSAVAQGTPQSIPAVLNICAPVVNEQYEGDQSRYGTCIAAVTAFTSFIQAPSAQTAEVIADLVVALADLYRFDEACRIARTELPMAIETAAAAAFDEEQRLQIIQVRQTIAACDVFQTFAIPSTTVAQGSPF